MFIDPALQERSRSSANMQDFNMGMAGAGAQGPGYANMDYPMDDDERQNSHIRNPMARPPFPGFEEKDPIWLLSKTEALRLVVLFDEEMGWMYPVLNIEKLTQHAKLLYTFIAAMSKNVFLNTLPGADAIQDEQTDFLKLVLAIAIVAEGTEDQEVAKKLVKSVNSTAENKLFGNVAVKDIQSLSLMVRRIHELRP